MSKQTIFVAGHNGMVGSALTRLLNNQNDEIITKNRAELDLLNQKDVEYFFKHKKIDQVYLAAAKVGGINGNNTYPADFIYQNLTIQNNVVHHAFLNGVKKLLFLGSSCIYPKETTQPIKEINLLAGKLEKTNEPYAIAKIAGIKLCESYNRQFGDSHGIDYRSLMPTNLYGPGDSYDLNNSHVIPALLRKFHEAKVKNHPKVKIWGSGKPLRDFLHVDDLAKASVFIMNLSRDIFYKKIDLMNSHVNVGSGNDLTIRELADIIKNVVNFSGDIEFDHSMPDGTYRKLLDSKLINNFGWKKKIDLKDGLKKTYLELLENNPLFT
jgi:GDP-L-fucose synthase